MTQVWFFFFVFFKFLDIQANKYYIYLDQRFPALNGYMVAMVFDFFWTKKG